MTALVGAAVLAACNSDPRSQIESRNVQVSLHDLISLELELESQIGLNLEAREDYEFYGIRDLHVDAGGNIYVIDQLEPGVRVFDGMGRFVRRIGRKGDGPGELQMSQLVAVSGDTVLMKSGSYIHIFRSDGAFVRRFRPHFEMARVYDMAFTVHGLYVTSFGTSLGGGEYEPMTVRVLSMSTETVGPPLMSLPFPTMYRVAGGHYRPAPLAAAARFAVAHDGWIYGTRSDSFAIEIVSPSAELEKRIIADVPPVAVSRDDIRRDLADALKTASVGYSTPAEKRATDPPAARYRPVIGDMLVDDDGRILIQRSDLLTRWADMDESAVWDLIEPNSPGVARVSIPRRFKPYVFRECTITGVFRDTMDVPTVMRYRLRNPAANGACTGVPLFAR